jgi:hypothetical protein
MDIDGVRVVLREGDRQSAPIEHTKDIVGMNVGDQGELAIMGKVEVEPGKFVGVPFRIYAPGVWHHCEPINLHVSAADKLVVPKPTLLVPGSHKKMQA